MLSSINGQTNVISSRFGAGSINGIGKEVGKFVVMTMEIPWQITKDLIGSAPEAVIFIDSVEKKVLDREIDSLPSCDSVIGIGGGRAIDAAKYMAWKRNIRLITIPTILSVDAFVTPAAAVRGNHEVVYIGNVSPDPLIIDYDVIRTAPVTLNIAGIGDILSVHTATYDWELAEQKGKSEYVFSKEDIVKAREILYDLYAILPAIRGVTDTGLQAIVDGYMRLNTICIPAGHSRVEEGSEHYLFYELEERLQRAFIHGHIIGLGIYLMSRLQNNQVNEITRIMDEVGLEYHPVGMNIKKTDLIASLKNLKSFIINRENLWYTIINDTPISDEWILWVLSCLKF